MRHVFITSALRRTPFGMMINENEKCPNLLMSNWEQLSSNVELFKLEQHLLATSSLETYSTESVEVNTQQPNTSIIKHRIALIV